jgi:hypothetical protein
MARSERYFQNESADFISFTTKLSVVHVARQDLSVLIYKSSIFFKSDPNNHGSGEVLAISINTPSNPDIVRTLARTGQWRTYFDGNIYFNDELLLCVQYLVRS